MSTFGGVSPSSHPPPPPSFCRTATTNNNIMSIASDSRSWSVSTFSNAVSGVGGGRSLPETKEQSNWIHLSTPNHHLTLTLKLYFRPHTQADLDNCRPLLLIHTGNEVLESLGLDRASVRSSKLRGVVKGSMIGFRYTSSSSSSASVSLAPAPGSSQSEVTILGLLSAQLLPKPLRGPHFSPSRLHLLSPFCTPLLSLNSHSNAPISLCLRLL
ncbi:hypothetical protein K457DRAFT_681217 [Linnemannia elongata AG-77]|uniref:Uncharacterized protein n=1 Tax=Linnemannia elongata AG-77 TaxID=1314771 RepID=A0A197JNJ9_9FUNG|nr:hypothetical protein K457DRAFT_681217 [Linnemannia elongata AG-77]